MYYIKLKYLNGIFLSVLFLIFILQLLYISNFTIFLTNSIYSKLRKYNKNKINFINIIVKIENTIYNIDISNIDDPENVLC
jgi:hypothetical protein